MEKIIAYVIALLEAIVGYVSTKEGGTFPANLVVLLAQIIHNIYIYIDLLVILLDV